MFMRYEYLSEYPRVFRSMTGLAVSEFDELVIDVEPCYETTEQERLTRPDRIRAPGGGHPFEVVISLGRLVLAVIVTKL